MDALILFGALAAILVVLDLLALRYGVDSRETIGDDWARAVLVPRDRATGKGRPGDPPPDSDSPARPAAGLAS